MSISRKDYRAIAAAIKEVGDSYGTNGSEGIAWLAVREVAKSVAEALRVQGGFTTNGNRRFDKDRFMEAAGFGEEKA